MELFIKVIFLTEKQMDLDEYISITVTYMKEKCMKINPMVLELIFIMRGQNTSVNGYMMKCMDKGRSIG